MTVWFTADLHFNHAGIIRYCDRPFAGVEEMNEALISRWNEVVRPEDTVYVVGDLAFGHPKKIASQVARLKGRKHLIEGNHDRANRIPDRMKAELFQSVAMKMEICIQDADAWQGRRRITLDHYAQVTWRERAHGGYCLHGHSHGNFQNEVHCPSCGTQIHGDCLRLDVGVDVHDYRPISYEQVKAIMNAKVVLPHRKHEV